MEPIKTIFPNWHHIEDLVWNQTQLTI